MFTIKNYLACNQTTVVLLVATITLIGAGCKNSSITNNVITYYDPGGLYLMEAPADWTTYSRPDIKLMSFQYHRAARGVQVADAQIDLRVIQPAPDLSSNNSDLDKWVHQHFPEVFGDAAFQIGSPAIHRESQRYRINYPVVGRDGYAGQYTVFQIIATQDYVLEVFAFALAQDHSEQAALAAQIEGKLTTLRLKE